MPMGTYEEILALLKTDGEIARSQIVEWMKSDDIRVLGALYRVTSGAYHRIKPELGMEASCDFILNYLARCIVENPHKKGDDIYSRYTAGTIMSSWMKHLWNKRPQTEKVLEKVTDMLAEIYLLGDPEVRGCIVYAVLENVFTDDDMLILFKRWKKKPQLREAYDTALEYAKKRLQDIPDSILQGIMGSKGNA
jgi:hypothetical protein